MTKPPERKQKRLNEDEKAHIWDSYFNKKESSEGIAKRVGVSGVAVRMFIKRKGGVIRDAVESHRSKALNETAFDILTPEGKYWLGVLMTDGCVYDDKNEQSSPRIELQWKDVDKGHLETFDMFMGGGGRINKHTKAKNTYYRWDARSQHLAATLLAYGISPRKTKTASPSDSVCRDPDFWRGCWDGDGEVDQGNNCPVLTLTGSFKLIHAFCVYFAEVCPEYPLKPRPTGHTNCTAYINLYGYGAMVLLKLIYQNATVAMPRKMQTAKYLLERHEGRDFRILKADIKQQETFPYTYTNLLLAQSDFEALKRLDAKTLLVQTIKTNSSLVETSTIKKTPIGMYASHFFHEGVRMKARVRGEQSPADVWADPSQREIIIEEARNRKHSNLRASITANCRMCWGFSPAVAKAVYQRFGASIQKVKILDPCAGWGDRLTAAISLPNLGTYVGYDPNSSLYNIYERIINCYGGNGKAKLYTAAFEVMGHTLPSDEFDIAFTSPPYFDYEEYSDDAEQSYKKYTCPAEWRKNFLGGMTMLCARSLKQGGVMAINIENAGRAPLVDWLVESVNGTRAFHFMGTMLMPTGNFDRAHEGIYCWRKI